MGQYYIPVNIYKLEYLNSHDYDSGFKLMEHSWIGNSFVEIVEDLLSEDGTWNKDKIVWAGDYMDDGLFVDNEDKNLYSEAKALGLKLQKENKRTSYDDNINKYRYIINHTKKEYVDKTTISSCSWASDYYVHPLPLLTSSGNGRGGGDYRSDPGQNYVGYWAGDSISVGNEIPEDLDFTKITTRFKE